MIKSIYIREYLDYAPNVPPSPPHTTITATTTTTTKYELVAYYF